MRLHPFAVLAGLLATVTPLAADSLSKKIDIDFYRDVPSRNLKGLATRSDGRLVSGAVLTELTGAAPADLLWCLEATPDANKWLVGTGPDGKIFEVTLDQAKASYTARELVKLTDTHVFALRRLSDGAVLAGSSPHGGLSLVREGKIVARVGLPVDSIFDLLVVDAHTVLVATGNPARIYRVDLAKFATAGLSPDKLTDAKQLAAHGVNLFGEVRDRNIRRIAALPDGRIAAGSAPKGNVYVFPRDGGAPVILQENHDAEVTDLLPQANGDLYASIVYGGIPAETRVAPPAKLVPPGTPPGALAVPAPAPVLLAPAPVSNFSGRSSIIWFPANGFPEVLSARNNVAIYRLAREGDLLLGAGGEQGELLGYDLKAQLALTFAGSASSQLYGFAPMAGQPGRFVVLRNNAAGLAFFDLHAAGPRTAETRRLDLGTPAQLGALRFNRLRNVADSDLKLEIRISNGTDEIEGWSPWTPLKLENGGWIASGLRGRYAKLRVTLPDGSARVVEVDKAALYLLPQNRRPQLQDFRELAPNFGLVPAPEGMPPATISLGQLLTAGVPKDADRRKNAFMASQVVPQPGTQLVLWSVTDPDGDNLLSTFSIRKDGDTAWTDLVVGTADSFVQFDVSHLAEGVYFTRLVVTETAPRPEKERLSTTFTTDDLTVDHTPPDILEASAKRNGDILLVTIHGRDALSLLQGIEANFNNGLHEETEQPVDGIRDSREETFILEIPAGKTAGATSVEVILYDAAGNSTSRRLTW
ncbi:MAG: hypothetical protein ABI222_05665 [Opitutaceae bacterium]